MIFLARDQGEFNSFDEVVQTKRIVERTLSLSLFLFFFLPLQLKTVYETVIGAILVIRLLKLFNAAATVVCVIELDRIG